VGLIELIIVVLVLIWLIGFFGSGRVSGVPSVGGVIHLLLVIVLLLIVLRFLNIV
jgi:hypothetical protein